MRQFYQCDDISRMAPGKRDVVTVRSSNGKEKVQKRHLYMSIKETFLRFSNRTFKRQNWAYKIWIPSPRACEFSSKISANLLFPETRATAHARTGTHASKFTIAIYHTRSHSSFTFVLLLHISCKEKFSLKNFSLRDFSLIEGFLDRKFKM